MGVIAEKTLPEKKIATRTQQSGVRRRLLPLLDSYLFWSFFGNALRGLCWFAGLFLAFAIVSGAQKVAQKGVPFIMAMEAVALQMPRIILFTIPASLLFGAVSAFTEMSAKGEVTAMMAGGMSIKRLMRAPLVLAIFLSIFAFWLQETVVPNAELRKGTLLIQAATTLAAKGFKIVDTRSNGTVERIIQANSFDPEKKLLMEPRIQLFRADNTVETEIAAQFGFWDEKSKSWTFKNGINRYNPANKTEASVRVPFSEFSVATTITPEPAKLRGGDGGITEQIEDNNFEMVSWRQLAAYRTEKLAEFRPAKGQPKPDAAERKNLRKRIRAATFGIHDKIATPLIVIAMVLVGIPLGIRPQRTASPGLAMGLSLIVMLGYYIFWTICSQLGKGGIALAEVVAYLPLVVLLGIGSVLIAQKS